MVELSGGLDNARIGVVTAANESPESSGEYYVKIFKIYGAKTVYWVPVQEADPGAAHSDEVVENILTMGGIFFGGGEVWRIVNTLFTEEEGVRVDTLVLAAIREVWKLGAMVGGTSAGIEALPSNIMITGGYSYSALVYGATTSSDNPTNLTYDPLGGLGFLDGVIIDAHFSERERQGRLTRLVSDTRTEERGAVRGLGLDEDTALVCSAGVCQVYGSGGVWAVDLTDADIQLSDGWWSCSWARTDYLTLGDTLSLLTWTVEFATWKSDLSNQEVGEEVATYSNLFNGSFYLEGSVAPYNKLVNSLMQSKADVTHGNTQYSTPALYQLQFYKSQDTRRVIGQDQGSQTVFISYQNLTLFIVPGFIH